MGEPGGFGRAAIVRVYQAQKIDTNAFFQCLLRVAQHLRVLCIDVQLPAVQIELPGAGARAVEYGLQAVRLLAQGLFGQAHLHRPRSGARELGQDLAFLGVQAAGLPVNHAQCPDALTGAQAYRRACIEADVRLTQHQRVVGEARIERGIAHLKQLVALDGMCAKRPVPWRLRRIRQTEPGLEPLAIVVNQADQRNRRFAQLRGGRNQRVKNVFGRAVEYLQRIQSRLPFQFIGGKGRWGHADLVGVERTGVIIAVDPKPCPSCCYVADVGNALCMCVLMQIFEVSDALLSNYSA